MFPALIPLILQGALDVSAEKDKAYFTEKIEKMLGCKFSEASFLESAALLMHESLALVIDQAGQSQL